MKKTRKYTYGGYDIDGEIQPIKINKTVNPNDYKSNLSATIDPNKVQTVQSNALTAPAVNTFDLSSLVSSVGQGIQAFNGIKSTIAQGISTGVDVANTAMGAIDSARLKREEQQRIADSLLKPVNNIDNRAINNIPIYTKFGGKAKYGIEVEGGDSNPNIEAEDGEILEHADGTIFEADGKRHEQGGEKFANISRVLEDTAGKRKDPLSKALVIDKDTATKIVGKPVKKGLSHAKLFDLAGKEMAKLQSKYVVNAEKIDKEKSPDIFAINSAKLNSQFGSQLPTSGELFDELFNHQEAVKEGYDLETGNKMAYGGPGPKKPIVSSPTSTSTPMLPTKESDRVKYYNPKRPESTGNWMLDALSKNEYLLDTPIIGDMIRKKAHAISQDAGVVNLGVQKDDELPESVDTYTGAWKNANGKQPKVDLYKQYLYGDQNLSKAKYKPSSDYLEFLPTYSLKDKFGVNKQINTITEGNKKVIDQMMKDKKPRFDSDPDVRFSDPYDMSPDLGSYKMGLGYDKETNLPYMSISDAWDFEPVNYANKRKLSLKGEEAKLQNKQTYQQSYLMHKAGKPFKIYDRFYIDPKTYKYMDDPRPNNLPKKAYGGEVGPEEVPPYKGGRRKTPTGRYNGFTGDIDALQNTWKPYLDEGLFTNAGLFQTGVYDHLMGSPEGRDQLRTMWKTYGNTDKGVSLGQKAKFADSDLTDDKLPGLRNSYIDGLAGARTLAAKPLERVNYQVDPIKNRPLNTQSTLKPLDPSRVQPVEALPQEPEFKLNTDDIKSKFNMPLGWNDVIGPMAGLMNAMNRDPELYNPVDIAKVKYQLQDVRPVLNNNQAEYNAAVQSTPNNSVGAALRAQLFANKLKADGSAIGQYENQNKQIMNQQESVNAEADTKQSMADANSRQSFYDRVLTARGKQANAKIDAISQLGDIVSKNKAFNKNGNMLMKLAPYFDQNADYNGKKYTFSNNGQQVTGVEKAPAGMTQYKVTRKDGKEEVVFLTDKEYQIKVRDKDRFRSIQKISR